MRTRIFAWSMSVLLVLGFISIASAQKSDGQNAQREVTLLVTAVAHNDRTREIARKLQPSDFAVLEEKQPQKVIAVEKISERPVVAAVLIQDNLIARVNNEYGEIRRFIRGLPAGSKVMVGYVSSGFLRVRVEFTDDLEKAAKGLRIIPGSNVAAPYSPFTQLRNALKKFDGQPEGRRVVLMVTNGIDSEDGFSRLSPFFSVYLDGAIRAAQERGVAVYSMFAPAAGRRGLSRRAVNVGQGALLRLADRTGGEAFLSGRSFVTFSPYFKELDEIMKNQWKVRYVSNLTGKGFRKVEVTTDFDIELHHQSGYTVD